jgi:nonsense-mediated mRNA decay protein 3
MVRICPLCGRKTDVVINGLCPSCYVKKHGILDIPSIVEAQICRYCGSVKIGVKWVPSSSFEESIESIIKYVLEKAKPIYPFKKEDVKLARFEYETYPNWLTRVRLTVKTAYMDHIVEKEYEITVKLKPSICPACKTRVSGEYDTVLQIRGFHGKNLEDLILKTAEKLNLGNQIVDIINSKDGVDVYFTNTGAARKIARKIGDMLGGRQSQIHYEDVTVSSTGTRRARKTIVLRLDKKDSYTK